MMEPAREFNKLFLISNSRTNFYFSSHSLIPSFQETGANLAKEVKPGSEDQDLAKQRPWYKSNRGQE